MILELTIEREYSRFEIRLIDLETGMWERLNAADIAPHDIELPDLVLLCEQMSQDTRGDLYWAASGGATHPKGTVGVRIALRLIQEAPLYDDTEGMFLYDDLDWSGPFDPSGKDSEFDSTALGTPIWANWAKWILTPLGLLVNDPYGPPFVALFYYRPDTGDLIFVLETKRRVDFMKPISRRLELNMTGIKAQYNAELLGKALDASIRSHPDIVNMIRGTKFEITSLDGIHISTKIDQIHQDLQKVEK